MQKWYDICSQAKGVFMKLIEDKKYLIVTRREYFPILFSYKNKHPKLNLKFITKQDFASKVSFSFAKDPIPELIKQGIDYSRAKKYLHIFLFGNLDKNEKVKKIFEYIPKDYLAIDEYGLTELKRYDEIIFFEMSEDKELLSLATRKGVSYSLASFVDLYFEDEIIDKVLNEDWLRITNFKNKFMQFFYVYGNIRKRLLENPDLQDQIVVICDGGEDLYYINYCSDLFGVKTMLVTQRKILSIDSIRNKVRNIFNSKSFAFTEEELKDNDVSQLRDLIKQYGLDSLENFEFAYSCLTEIINSKTFNQIDSREGITTTDNFYVSDNTINYVTNFQHDTFYKISSDNDVLTDKELEEVEINTSYVKTKIDKSFKNNFLSYNNIVLLSRVGQHLTDKIFDSEFISENNWTKKVEIYDQYNLDDIALTTPAANLFRSFVLDGLFCNKIPEFDYRTFDHSYKQIDGKIFADDKVYSLTDLEKYIDCPFAYLMKKILPSNDYDPRSRYLGDLVHKLCENIFDKKYDFEKEWDIAANTYRECFKKEKIEYQPYDEVILDVYHTHLKRLIPLFLSHSVEMGYVDSISELPIYFTLKDEEGRSYKFSGQVDKIVRSKAEGEKEDKYFWTIIDYKTGSESFDIYSTPYGRSVQLPLYYYALKTIKEEAYPASSFRYPLEHVENLKNLIGNASSGGFGIQHVYAYSLKNLYHSKDKDLLKEQVAKDNAKLDGISRYDASYYQSFDVTITPNNKGNLTSGEYLKISTIFSESDAKENIIKKSGLEKYNFEDVVNDSIQGMIRTIKAIEANDFKIAPAVKPSLKDKVNPQSKFACDYCQYKDICYHNSLDKKTFASEIKEHFKLEK